MFPSGFGSIGTFGCNGVETEFNLPRPSFCSIHSIYLLEDMVIDLGVQVISIPTILEGSLRSVICHLLSISEITLCFSSTVVTNMRRLSTQTVMMAKSSPTHQ